MKLMVMKKKEERIERKKGDEREQREEKQNMEKGQPKGEREKKIIMVKK